MKKTYKNPTMEIVKIQNAGHLLAGSEIAAKGSYGDGSGITLGSHDDDFDW